MLFRFIELLAELIDAARGYLSKLLIRSASRKIQQTGQPVHRKYIIVCLHDKSPRPDLTELFSRLSRAGFGIVGVTSNDAANQFSDQLDITVNIAPIGRDFLAYQQGYRALKKLGLDTQTETLCFLNDSVWFFKPHQQAIIDAMLAYLEEGKLVAGTLIFDYIPHCSGWLFALPYNKDTRAELESLFAENFVRQSRKFNIRKGEHKVLSMLQSVNGVISLDQPHATPAYPYCYAAINQGLECFYMKGDSTLRLNPSKAKFEEFLQTNCSEDEKLKALQWLSRRADALLDSPLRLQEMHRYRRHYFK